MIKKPSTFTSITTNSASYSFEMTFTQAVKAMAQWVKSKVKMVKSPDERGYALRRLRMTRMRGINVRNAAVRQRSKMDKTLNKVHEMMDNCGCGEDSNGNQVVEGVRCVDDKSKTQSITRETVSGSGIASEHDHDQEIQKIDGNEHEYIRDRDVPRHLGSGLQSECGLQTGHTHGEDENGEDNVDNQTVTSTKCAICRVSGAAADKVEKVIMEMNDTIRTLNDRIIEYGKQIAELEEHGKADGSAKNEGTLHADTLE